MTVGFTENLAVISVHNVLYVDREFETDESPNGEMFILGSSKSDIHQPPKKETLEYL